jgi:hypothetical protein
MASTTTTELGLFKPIPGSAEPFRTTDVNNNWDILDGVVAGYEDRIAEAEASLAESVEDFEADGAAAIAAFEIEADAAIATLDTAQILDRIDEGFSINGGTA